jgi:hypothetical protein
MNWLAGAGYQQKTGKGKNGKGNVGDFHWKRFLVAGGCSKCFQHDFV